ncbi:MAG: hypothetical protein GY915_02910, partial [bacterium]|nr:hypothetical protein [bacterium]
MTSLHSRSFTPYQKRIIKAVEALVGNRPFSAGKAQNNHLQLKIEGIDKPLYTGATPSDCKAFENFMSQVRTMLRASETNQALSSVCHVCPSEAEPCPFERIMKGMVKNYRNTLDGMIQKETDWVMGQGDVEGISTFREQRVKADLSGQLRARKNMGYVKPSQIR